METKQNLLGLTAYSKHLGLTLSYVRTLVDNGKIPFILKDGKRWIDVAEGDAAYKKNVSRSNSGPKAPAMPQENVPNALTQEAYFKAYRARLAKLNYETKSGKLIEKEQVHRQIFTSIRIVRDALRNVPQKIAHELASEVDPHRCELILIKEIDDCLLELSRLADDFR